MQRQTDRQTAQNPKCVQNLVNLSPAELEWSHVIVSTLSINSMRKPAKQQNKSNKPRARRARGTKKSAFNVPEMASCKELYSITGMISNTPYKDIEQNLGDFARASSIAKSYQEFRIKYIKYKFIARYNTFQASTAESNVFPIPLLYTRIDKAGALPTATSIVQLKEMGCKPVRFTTNQVRAWSPGVQLNTSNSGTTVVAATKPLISPWLMTNKAPDSVGWTVNDTDHFGLYWFMETAGLPGDGTYEYDAEVEIGFEFRKPLAQTTSPNEAISVQSLRKGVSTPSGTLVPATV